MTNYGKHILASRLKEYIGKKIKIISLVDVEWIGFIQKIDMEKVVTLLDVLEQDRNGCATKFRVKCKEGKYEISIGQFKEVLEA